MSLQLARFRFILGSEKAMRGRRFRGSGRFCSSGFLAGAPFIIFDIFLVHSALRRADCALKLHRLLNLDLDNERYSSLAHTRSA